MRQANIIYFLDEKKYGLRRYLTSVVEKPSTICGRVSFRLDGNIINELKGRQKQNKMIWYSGGNLYIARKTYRECKILIDSLKFV